MGNTNMREGLASEPGVDSASEVGSPSVDSASPASGFGHGARAVPLDASSAASLVSETDSSNPENTLSSERIAAIHERNDWLIAADQALADVRRRSYEGMLVGERNQPGDMVVNIARTKNLGNQRSSTADISVQLVPPRTFSLEEALEYIMDDELVEVTPKNIRMRKRILNGTERRKWAVRHGLVNK